MKKILLFGAYANGNVGDAGQAASMVRHINKAFGRDNVTVFTASHNPANCDYDSAGAVKAVNMKDIKNVEYVNSFDALIIGGGGLLASVHRPLNSTSWVDAINIPILIAGVGANKEVVQLCAALVNKATLVSARDDFSYGVLKEVRDDVFFLRDPILCDRSLDTVYTPKGYNAFLDDICFIPRKENSKNLKLHSDFSKLMSSKDIVLSVFPATDSSSNALSHFEKMNVFTSYDIGECCDIIKSTHACFSERYHGCILALKQGVACVGLVNSRNDINSKVSQLYKMLEIENMCISARENEVNRELLSESLNDFDFKKIKEKLNSFQDEFDNCFSEMMSLCNLK